MNRDLLLLIGIVSAFLAVGGVLIATRSLPEDYAKDFRALTAGNITLDSEIQVLRQPTPGDDTYIYVINDAAKKALYIALNETHVQQILDEAKGKSVTIAAVQPTLLVTSGGESIHSSGGQVIITANWQLMDGKVYSIMDFDSLNGKKGESHQQIWNVIINMDSQEVTNLFESKRVMEKTLQKNLVFEGMNMFMPNAVEIDAGTAVKWFNESNVPHNVVGFYSTESGSRAVDSGFVQRDHSWQYDFVAKGVFEYHCTIHTEEGMKGTIVVG